MPTATRNRPRAHRVGPGRYARAATSRGQGLRRRRQPQPTGVKKLLTRVPGRAAKQATPRSKKGMAGGLAVGVAAAAGMLLKRGRKGRKDTPSGAGA
jgi:predicted lipid-binding transport protein (Tim44 family)